MSQLNVNVRFKTERDIKTGEILELVANEIYIKPGYGNGTLMIEVTAYPIPEPKESDKK